MIYKSGKFLNLEKTLDFTDFMNLFSINRISNQNENV